MTMFLFGMTAGACVCLGVVFIVVKMNEKDEKGRQDVMDVLRGRCNTAMADAGVAKWSTINLSTRCDRLEGKVSNLEARTDNLLTYVDDAIGSHEGLYHIPDPKPVKKDKKK